MTPGPALTVMETTTVSRNFEKCHVKGWKSRAGACRYSLLTPPSVPSVRHPVPGPERTDT
jgi:hypothetical protein